MLLNFRTHTHTQTKEQAHTRPQQAAPDIDKATKHPPKCVNFKVSTLEFRFSLVFRFFGSFCSTNVSCIFREKRQCHLKGFFINENCSQNHFGLEIENLM